MLLLFTTASCNDNKESRWNKSTQCYEMPAYNLQWDLRGLNNAIISNRKTANLLFLASEGDITFGLISAYDPDHTYDINNPSNFVKTILPAELIKAGFKMDSRKSVETWKKEYLSHEAIKFAAIVHFAEVGDEHLPLWGGGYIFTVDEKEFIAFAFAPPFYIKKFGLESLDSILNRLTYIKAPN